MSQKNTIVAIKAISHKLAQASYYVLRDQVMYDEKRLFGGKAEPVVGLVHNQQT
jgi:transposase